MVGMPKGENVDTDALLGLCCATNPCCKLVAVRGNDDGGLLEVPNAEEETVGEKNRGGGEVIKV
jgi:hypothetical protein